MKNSSLSPRRQKEKTPKGCDFFSSDVTLDFIFQITNYLGMFHHYNNHSGIYINMLFIYTYIHLHTFTHPWIKPRYFLRNQPQKAALQDQLRRCAVGKEVENRWGDRGDRIFRKRCLIFTPNHGKCSNLTIILFNWVGSTT